MITYRSGNLFDSAAPVLVNPVNTVGVMGKGLAKAFKDRYPEMVTEYRGLCLNGQFDIGMLWLYHGPDRDVLNFPTKRHWRSPSKLAYIEAGLIRFVEVYEAWGISGIAFPALGCGLGGLSFEGEVRPLMESYLAGLSIQVEIFEPASPA